MFLLILALVALSVTIGGTIEAVKGLRRIKNLAGISVDNSAEFPSVTIVAAARNEEKNIRNAVFSLLRLDYPRKKLVIVNDRSTDRTGEILKEISTLEPALRIITVNELPAGWLGKNHALYQGAQAESADYYLFTDADVVMDPSVLKRAMIYMRKNNLDHLAAGPKADMPGIALNVFLAGFGVFFNMFTRPWRAREAESKAHIGIGAFNLVRRSAYEKIGTHQAIAMRPDDDLKLGKLIKKYGLRQDFVMGASMITVEWYDTIRKLIDGLMKNAFSGVDYKVSMIIAGTLVHLVFIVWPYVGIFVSQGTIRLVYLMNAALLTVVCMISAHQQRTRVIYGFGLPLASLLFIYILWKATLRTINRGGIEWRGTFYSLDELKRNKI